MTVYHRHLKVLDGPWRVRNGNAELERLRQSEFRLPFPVSGTLLAVEIRHQGERIGAI